MRSTWFAMVVALGLGAGCGSLPNTFTDAGTDASAVIDGAGTCTPACATNATCTGTTCACDDGYMGDGLTCTDVNECATANGGCDTNALCTNTPGARTCACKRGFVGDGVTCQAAWTLVGSFPNVVLDQGNNRGFDAVGQGTKIYFAPKWDTTPSTMRAIDVVGATVSGDLAVPPGAQNDFFAGGFGEVFLADGSGLYLIGDEAYRYSPATNAWAAIPGYTGGTIYMRGESAGAYGPGANAIMLVGGRDWATNSDTASATRYDIGVGWKTEPGTLPFTHSGGAGYSFGGTTYIAGGRSGDASRRHLVSHTITQTAWTTLADAPGDLATVTGIGEFTSGGVVRLVVSAGAKAYFYEPVSNTWDITLDLPTTTLSRLVMVGGNPYVIAQNGTAADVYKLAAIE